MGIKGCLIESYCNYKNIKSINRNTTRVVFKRMKLLWVLSTIVSSIKNNKILTEICLFLANDVPTYIGTVVKSNFQSLIFLPIFKSSQKETAMQRSLTIIKIPLFASDAYLTTLF